MQLRPPLNWYWLFLPVILFAFYVWSNPFDDVILRDSVSLQNLSPAQKNNIKVAAERLNGVVLAPQQMLSINQLLGPRTVAQGFLEAPSYLGDDRPNTPGGGICLLASLLYRMALTCQLEIVERVPHQYPIHSVPSGLDATLWYGQADLKIKNPYPTPIRLTTQFNPTMLTLAFNGKRGGVRLVSLDRQVVYHPRALQVRVFQKDPNGTMRWVSTDLYRLSSR